jgi:peptide-methionine (S)-S-oxide reductase
MIGEDFSADGPEIEVATLGGGCFWCLEAVFLEVQGVESATSGYSGGSIIDPTYEQVCGGKTGHAEVVQVVFDPAIVPYGDLLKIFFSIHDPTSLNRQGADVGTQYRSAIFFHSQEQKSNAEEVISELNQAGIWKKAIVTEVVEFADFYPAEEYHTNYFQRNSRQPYCQVVISPKLSKFRKQYTTKLKSN